MVGTLPSDATSERPRVMVFGGTGMIGSAIVSELRRRDIDTTVFARPTSKVDATIETGARLAVGDVLEEASILRALGDRRYDAVGSRYMRRETIISPRPRRPPA
jgi:nucleoside-diphosphate-sugar epimerase